MTRNRDAGARDVVDDAAALQHDARHHVKIRVQQRDLRHAAGGVASAGHGDGAVRRLKGGDVVHAVSYHGHAMAVFAQRLDQPLLILGGYAAENGVAAGQGGVIL